MKENQDAIELVADTFETKFKKLAKTVKSVSPDYEVDPNEGKGKKFKKDLAEEWKEKRNNKNK